MNKNKMTVNDLINKLLKGITEGRIDGDTVVYVQGQRTNYLDEISKVGVEKVGHIGKRVIIKL
jgi:hypothetical protein